MSGKLRGNLTYANVVSTLCLFLLLGGGAYAAVHLKKNSVGTRQIKNGAVTQTKISASAQAALTTIPSASITADELSPELKASLTLQCPSGLNRAGGICYEPSLRPPATFASALQVCAAAGRWLPSVGELVLVFDHLGAPQNPQWVATQYVDSNGPDISFVATLLSENASRAIGFGYDSADPAIPHPQPYRCVTSATN